MKKRMKGVCQECDQGKLSGMKAVCLQALTNYHKGVCQDCELSGIKVMCLQPQEVCIDL